MSTPATPRVFIPPTESDIPMHGWRPYSDIHRERVRAHAKHDFNGDSMERVEATDIARWMSVIGEEFGEVFREVCEARHATGDPTQFDHKNMRKELVQLAAMTVAWIEAIDCTNWELEIS